MISPTKQFFLSIATSDNGRFGAVQLVALDHVQRFVLELETPVSSVTIWNSIYKLRRAAECLAPGADFGWLSEIEKDLALVAEPQDKTDRLVLADRLLEAGLTLIQEAESFASTPMRRARGVRNGLMIALLALHPLRNKNESAFWISSTRGAQFTIKNMGTLISKITTQALGVDVSPHLFRMAATTTAAVYGASTPFLASGILGHRDKRITEEHYNRARSLHAASILADIIEACAIQAPESERTADS